jgi:hypothetical protein
MLNTWRPRALVAAGAAGAGQTVTQALNATLTQSGTAVTAKNVSYNGAVATNGTASFGFNGSWIGSNPVPTSFAVNGVTCTGSTTAPRRPADRPDQEFQGRTAGSDRLSRRRKDQTGDPQPVDQCGRQRRHQAPQSVSKAEDYLTSRTADAASQPAGVNGSQVTVSIPARSISTVVLTS